MSAGERSYPPHDRTLSCLSCTPVFSSVCPFRHRFGIASVCTSYVSPVTHLDFSTGYPQLCHRLSTLLLICSIQWNFQVFLVSPTGNKPAKPINEHAFARLLRGVEDTSKFRKFCFGQTCKTCAKPAKLMCCHPFSSYWRHHRLQTRLPLTVRHPGWPGHAGRPAGVAPR